MLAIAFKQNHRTDGASNQLCPEIGATASKFKQLKTTTKNSNLRLKLAIISGVMFPTASVQKNHLPGVGRALTSKVAKCVSEGKLSKSYKMM